jgi:hypothetical protein
LSKLRQRDLSVADYTLKINEICDSFALIDVVEEQAQHRQHASARRAVGTDQCELI